MSNVTTTTIVSDLQVWIDEVKADKKLDLTQKIKLVTQLTDRQLRAGALTLQYARYMSRIPDEAQAFVPRLDAAPQATLKQ